MQDNLEQLVAAAPVNENQAAPEFVGIREAFATAGVDPGDVIAVTQCQFGTANIEALVDDDTIGFIHPAGILCSTGKRKLFSKTVKYNEVRFSQCQGFAPCEYTDERGFGKYGIEFGGPGSVLLGRIYWRWKAKRFRDSRQATMTVAEERDRILGLVTPLLGANV